MKPWVECSSFDLQLDKPANERYTAVPDEAVQRALALLGKIAEGFTPRLAPLADVISARTDKRFQEQIEGLADRLGIDWRSLLLANISYDLEIMRLGCSTCAIPTPDGPILARNLDWDFTDLLSRGSYLTRYLDGTELKYITAGWAGTVGVVTGMSAKGFALALNYVMCPEKVDMQKGYPVLLFLRRVMEDANSFEEAVEMVSTETLMAPGLITIVGTENAQRVCVERSPSKSAQRWGEEGKSLCATNDYCSLFDGQNFDGFSDGRFEGLCDLTKEMSGDTEVEDETILSILTNPRVIQLNTAQHVIARPYAQTIRVWYPSRFAELAYQGEA